MVESAVISEMRRLLATPEVVAKVVDACRQDSPSIEERCVVEALRNFTGLWERLIPAEQSRIVRLLVDRVTIGHNGMTVDLRNNGIALIVKDMGSGASMDTVQ